MGEFDNQGAFQDRPCRRPCRRNRRSRLLLPPSLLGALVVPALVGAATLRAAPAAAQQDSPSERAPDACFQASSVSVPEGAGSAAFDIAPPALSIASGTREVKWMTLDGTATAGSDYAGVTTKQTARWIGAGNAQTDTRTVTVAITDDLIDEDDETFTVALSEQFPTISGELHIGVCHGTITIIDDDPPPTVSVVALYASVHENPAATSFTIRLSAPSAKTVTVDYSLGGTAQHLTDYTSVPLASSGTLTFAPGETTRQIWVKPLADGTEESDETITVTLTDPSNATVGVAGATSMITDDPQPRRHTSRTSVGEVYFERVTDECSEPRTIWRIAENGHPVSGWNNYSTVIHPDGRREQFWRWLEIPAVLERAGSSCWPATHCYADARHVTDVATGQRGTVAAGCWRVWSDDGSWGILGG